MIETEIKCPKCGSTFDVSKIKEVIKTKILSNLEFKIDKILKEI